MRPQPPLNPKIIIGGLKYHAHGFPISLSPSSLEVEGISVAHPEQKIQNV